MRWLLMSWKGVGLGLIALVVATGCGSSTRPASGASAASTGEKRIIIMTNGNSPFWDAARVGLQEAETDLGLNKAGYRAVLEVNDSTPQGQIDKLRQFASQSDIVAIGISPCDAANLAVAELLRDLKRKGVQVVTIDSDVDREKLRDARFAFIGTDNLAAGASWASALRTFGRREEPTLPSSAARAQNAMDRIDGVRQGAGDKFKALDTMADDTDLTRARENVRNAILNHPELNTLVVHLVVQCAGYCRCGQRHEQPGPVHYCGFRCRARGDPGDGRRPDRCHGGAKSISNGLSRGALLKALVEGDKKTMGQMFPNQEKPDGDLYDTGIKVVVPDQGSRLKPEMFDKKTQFLKLTDFRAWLEKYHLTGS